MPIITDREFTIEDLIVEFRDTRDREGRTYCPVVEKLEANRETWTIDDYEQWVFNHDQLAIPIIIDTIRTAGTHHPPATTAHIQTRYAEQLRAYPWERIHKPLEFLLLTREIAYGIAPDAMRILAEIVRDNHPNAKVFALRPDVHAKIPDDIDLSDWRCLDAPYVEPALVRGGRCCDAEGEHEHQHEQLTEARPFQGQAVEPGSHLVPE